MEINEVTIVLHKAIENIPRGMFISRVCLILQTIPASFNISFVCDLHQEKKIESGINTSSNESGMKLV